ncbi:MAG: hypothetical protein WCV62_03480 [Candidatus Peribacteraceae bacterium]|jgi:hypothetical protein
MGSSARTKRDPANDNRPEKAGIETPEVRPFQAQPEVLSQYLENVKADEVEAMMKSVEGREKLVDMLGTHAEDLQEAHGIDLKELREQIDLAGETLEQKERFLQDVQSPEKKGLFRRAWEKVKGFPRKHPVVTALLAVAAIAGATAAGFYLTGNWELLLSKIAGLGKALKAMGASGELIPPTPNTPPLPGGGVFEIPGGSPTPGLDIPT